jgi:hypothetical protein
VERLIPRAGWPADARDGWWGYQSDQAAGEGATPARRRRRHVRYVYPVVYSEDICFVLEYVIVGLSH